MSRCRKSGTPGSGGWRSVLSGVRSEAELQNIGWKPGSVRSPGEKETGQRDEAPGPRFSTGSTHYLPTDSTTTRSAMVRVDSSSMASRIWSTAIDVGNPYVSS